MNISETITINTPEYAWVSGSPLVVGEIIKIKGQKRKCLEVCKTTEDGFQHTIYMTKVYKASPRSRLKNKPVFSKVKCKVIK